jgi:hypothetical protein
MAQPRPWVEEVVIALTNLGGKAELHRIYDQVKDRGEMDFAANPNWKSAIRDALETHSSDSAIFKRKRDLFYSVAGIGRGEWGLRSLIPLTPPATDLEEAELPGRGLQVSYRILRDTPLAREVKASYGHKCQFCDTTVPLPDGSRYAEAHHVQPLGRPHSGPDVKENILCVCPLHHVLLDYGCIRLDVTQLRFHAKHRLDQCYIDYHNRLVFRPGAEPLSLSPPGRS